MVTSTDATGEFAFNSMEEGVYEVVPDPGSVGGISSTPDAALYRLVGDGDEESSTFVVVM